MPSAPPIFRCAGAPASRRDANRSYDAARRVASLTRRLYSTSDWQRLRADQLSREPLCRSCEAAGRVTAATVCDHVTPHRGDVTAFWRGPFQSLCDEAPWRCHSRVKQAEEAAAAREAAAAPRPRRGGGGVESLGRPGR